MWTALYHRGTRLVAVVATATAASASASSSATRTMAAAGAFALSSSTTAAAFCASPVATTPTSSISGLPLFGATPSFSRPRIHASRKVLSRRQMSFFGGSESDLGFDRIGREAMAEIIDDVSNGGREESGYVIIDVRGRDEIAAEGKLDDIVETVPLPEIAEGAFMLEDEDFEERYGFEKPNPDETLVFTCKAGIRSASAAKLAKMAGYSKIVDYMGGSNEWFMYKS